MDLHQQNTVFLFTDIEGSTKLWENHPDEMSAALSLHDQIAVQVVSQYGGSVVKSRGEGDSLFIVFEEAAAAVQGAAALQAAYTTERWPEETPIRVRMALHTGQVQARGGDYYGSAVNRTARLRAIAHGGQTILSNAVAELVRDNLSPSIWLHDLGSHGLKDLHQPEHVWQLCHESIPAEFPPLRSLEVSRHNLPIQTTAFVGREKEIAEIKRMLARSRLITLTGSGGSGKTRLAMQVAADMLDVQPDGVWVVELASIADPSVVPHTLAQVLNIREEGGRNVLSTLVEHLKQRSLLLLLDNCEHVLEECARIADSLIRYCADVRILASSRESLGIPGEAVFRVPSLSLPDPGQSSPDALLRFESVRLFLDRAAAVSPHFALTAQNAAALAQVCVRLDGIPLAVELAAARVAALPVEQIATRLNDRFRLLTGGSRTALPRQQTLRALIDWSYDLLNVPERTLMSRLSVFQGGWSLDAAEAICGGDGIEAWEVLDILSSLVNKSLVVFDEQSLGGRYRFLETVRQYARDRLLESGEGPALRDRHTAWFAELAVTAEPQLRSPDQQVWLNRLETEHDNLRAALDWSQDSRENSAHCVTLAGALWPFWDIRGYYNEGRTRLSAALDCSAHLPPSVARANALNGAGNLAMLQGDYLAAWTLHEESLEIRRALGDQRGIAGSLHNMGHVKKNTGEFGEAARLYSEALEINRLIGNLSWQTYNLTSLGNVAKDQGRYADARTYHEQSLAIARKLGDNLVVAYTLHNLGIVAYYQRDFVGARTLHEESLCLLAALGDKRVVTFSLDCLAQVATATGAPEWAAQVFGAAQSLREAIGIPLPPHEQQILDADLARVKTELGDELFAALHAAGRSMSADGALRFVLGTRAPVA